jgi:phospholipid/cholesterol/gamma-HCH transport system substrate-binding protein
MNDRTNQFRLGLFVLSALIVLGLLITMFGSIPNLFLSRDRYTVTLPSAPGVGPGTPVRRLGVRVGEVESVKIVEGQVRVDVVINRDQQLNDNEVPFLTHGMLGDAAIDFRPRVNGKPPQPLEPGAEMAGVVQIDIPQALTEASELVPRIGDSLDEIGGLARDTRKAVPEMEKAGQEVRLAARNWSSLGERLNVLVRTNEEKLIKTLDNLNQTLEQIAKVFNDENQRNLNATLKNVRGASDNLGSITKNTDQLLTDAQRAIKQIQESVQKADGVMKNLEQATKPMAERSDSVMRNLDESSAKLDKVLGEFRELLRMISQEDSTVNRLITDPSLYQNLDEAACMVTKILPRLDRILKDLEIFADKLARHPESIGIGGVVRPGSGIK